MSQSGSKIRWGILGVAKINQRLIPGFHLSKTTELRAIASRSLEKARHAATEANIPVAYGSYDELLADPQIDAVYIPQPNHLHYEWVCKAADAGKHILCEKPLTPQAKDSKKLIDYCHSKNIRLMDGFFWPHHPRTQQIRNLINQGRIGRVERVIGAFTFMLPLNPSNIRLQSDMFGGSLLDVGCYPAYGIRWAFGEEPLKANARAKYLHGVDIELSTQIEFSDNRFASFDCGFTLPFRAWLEIVGSEGIIAVPNMWVPDEQAAITIENDGGKIEQRQFPGHNQIVCMIDDFNQAIVEKRDAVPHPIQAVKTLALTDAITESARTGKEVLVAQTA